MKICNKNRGRYTIKQFGIFEFRVRKVSENRDDPVRKISGASLFNLN